MQDEKIIYVYLDESGHIHKNSRCKYFAIGGYMCLPNDRLKIKSTFMKNNKAFKKDNGKRIDDELKSYDYTSRQKVAIFDSVKDYNSFIGIAKVFEKASMWRVISNENIFYNYGVKVLFNDVIKNNIKDYDKNANYKIVLALDNRSIRASKLRNLQDYLNTEFCLTNFKFQVSYFDSKNKFEIQLADLVVNTIYNNFKDYSIVSDVIPYLSSRKFKYSLFPRKSKNNSKLLTSVRNNVRL